MTGYTYSIQADFPNHAVCVDRLALEIGATTLAALYHHTDTVGDECSVVFTEALTTDEKAMLDDLVAAHTGAPMTHVEFRASTALVAGVKEVTTQEWDDVGGVVTNVGFFVKDVARALGRVIGQVKCAGTGAQIRILKQDGSVLLGPVAIADSGGVWAVLSLTTSPELPLDSEERLYTVQARLNGATLLAFRYTSFTLLEICL